MPLKEYARKRNFSRTREPQAKAKGKSRGGHLFVIQKHDASRLHYDFRLEMEGVLKSWAVPKGLPFANGEKHLAIEVEDHPMEYARFEGTIPKGQYGGGTVMVWDIGKYQSLGGEPAHDLKEGKLHFALNGKKLEGEWTLVRLKRGGDNQWLLIKSGGGMKTISKKRDDQSAVSERTMRQIAGQNDAVWESGREHNKVAVEKLKFIEPMKAKFVDEPPHGNNWIYELKFDGYRAEAIKSGGKVRLLSRTEKDLSARFPDVVEAVQSLDTVNAILDGEIVALDEKGRSSFQLLQGLELGDARPPIVYYAFDLLHEDKADLSRQKLAERKARLEKLLHKTNGGVMRFSTAIRGEPKKMLKETGKLGLEGIVGKRNDSIYEPGRRSGAWIKLKSVNEQEFVIGGWTPPKGTRTHFGALLIGYHTKDGLRFVGKVGTGFDQKLIAFVFKKLKALEQEKIPFVNLPEKTAGRWEGNITTAELKRCKWVKPSLVCQIKFSEWTRDGKLRQPVFLGLRNDKNARNVSRERPV